MTNMLDKSCSNVSCPRSGLTLEQCRAYRQGSAVRRGSGDLIGPDKTHPQMFPGILLCFSITHNNPDQPQLPHKLFWDEKEQLNQYKPFRAQSKCPTKSTENLGQHICLEEIIKITAHMCKTWFLGFRYIYPLILTKTFI